MASTKTEELLKMDSELLLHPLTNVGETSGIVIDSGSGIILRDTEGKEYIDCSSQLGYCTLGHGNKEILEAIYNQMSKLEAAHMFWGMSNTSVIGYAKELAEIVPEGLSHFQFTSSGTEATDAAIKAARLFWRLQGKDKYKIVSLYGAYHGFGMATWATNIGMGKCWANVGPEAPGFVHIPPYYCYRCPFGLKYPDCDIRCARYLGEVIANEGPNSVAAFMAEPVMGAGGYIWPPPEYWPMVRKICDDYDILLIGDEVHSGLTRNGKYFALQHWDVKPDVITLAKAITSGYIPFGALAISDRIFQGLKGYNFPTGPTYSGHPAGCSAASAVLKIYKRDKIAEHSTMVAEHMMSRLKAEFASLPCVGDISEAKGLMIGLDLVANKSTKALLEPSVALEFWRQALEKGLLSRTLQGYYGNRLLIAPPCIISVEEADRILDIFLPILAGIKAN